MEHHQDPWEAASNDIRGSIRERCATSPWKTLDEIGDEMFYIHDNGARSYEVRVSLGDGVQVYAADRDDGEEGGAHQVAVPQGVNETDDHWFRDEPCVSWEAKEVEGIFMPQDYIGAHVYGNAADWIAFARGHVLLLKLACPALQDPTYVYIQRGIDRFTLPETLTGISSYVGNNDVPYTTMFTSSFAFTMADVHFPSDDHPEGCVNVAAIDDIEEVDCDLWWTVYNMEQKQKVGTARALFNWQTS